MAFLGRIHCPAVLNAIMLCLIACYRVASYFEPDEVSHHSTAGEIASCAWVVTAKISQPAHNAALHRYRGGTDRVRTYVLIDRRADKIRNNADRIGGRCNQAHVAGMPDIGAIRKQFLFNFL